MFGFPIGNGNSGYNDFVEKFTNNADSGFPKIQQREVFYSIKDGAINDATIWQTASGRVGLIPTQNDDVYLRHFITTTNISCNNLFISNAGTLYYTAGNHTISVFGNCINYGIINMAQSTTNLVLYGFINNLGNVIHNVGGTSYINYSGTIDQPIYAMDYRFLFIGGTGTKYLTGNTLVTGNFSGGSLTLKFEVGGFDLTVNGGTSCNNLSKNGGGKILLIGGASLGGVILYTPCTIEFRGGLLINFSGNNFYEFGGNPLIFTTNNQTISGNTQFVPNTDILISGGITLTNTISSGTGLTMSGKIYSDNASSKLTNQALITLTTQFAIENLASGGLYDFTTTANTIAISGNYSATIPSYFTTFHNLTISGTGTKTLSTNTTINNNLINQTGNFELSTYNLTVNGTTSPQSGYIKKSGAGNILFIGKVVKAGNTNLCLDFSGGNPNVECRNGIDYSTFGSVGSVFKSGTGTWSFTTNNQTIIDNSINLTSPQNFDGPIVIANDIVLTFEYVSININNTINGSNANSKIINKNALTQIGTINFTTTSAIMTTGTADFTTYNNAVGFTGNYTTTIPTNLDFYSLNISGTGTKSFGKNMTILGNLTNSGFLDFATYNVTINGQAIPRGGMLYKTGAGSVTFIGQVVTTIGNSALYIDFSGGNPSVEVRNGILISNFINAFGQFKSGTGTWSFTTNNQSIVNNSSTGGSPLTFSGNVFIGNGLTLTTQLISIAIVGTINGGDATSKLLIGTGSPITNYQNATQPMATGILDTSTNLNTWIYGLNAQNIKGGPTTLAKQVYRNLTLNGTGVKTLQGYVSVLNTYTLTSPATLALNGFTLTNP